MSDYPFNPLQGSWLALESKSTPMHMGGLLYFRKPKGAPLNYVSSLAETMRSHIAVQAPWNCRLSRIGRLARQARWVAADEVDLEYHFRQSALPAPGGERNMGELVSRLHAHPLDLSRPAWEVHLIEGLQDERFAIYVKIHPVMLDGLGVVDALKSFLSVDKKTKVAPMWCHRRAPRKGGTLMDNWPAMLRALSGRVRGGLQSSLSWTGIKRVPRSALNDRISGQRRFATQQYSEARLQQLAEPLGVSVEELIYYLFASALRRFFREYNALPDDPLIALLADRSRDDDMLNPLFISLGTHHSNRGKRLEEIRRSLQRARRQFAVLATADAKAEGTVDAMPYLLRQMLGVDHRLAPMFNVGIARMSLGDERLYMNGAELEAAFPMPMLLQGGAMNMAIMRYAQDWNIGLCGARENLPHLQRMAVYMGVALEELEAMSHE